MSVASAPQRYTTAATRGSRKWGGARLWQIKAADITDIAVPDSDEADSDEADSDDDDEYQED